MKTADKTRETPAFPKTFIMAMIFGVGLNPVNSTLISTALAPISHDLRIDAGRATLLISALYLTCAIAQPTAGKLSEIIGPRSVFMAGAALVMIGGLLGGFAPNLGVLLTSRVLIGAGTSCGYPAAMLLVRRRLIAWDWRNRLRWSFPFSLWWDWCSSLSVHRWAACWSPFWMALHLLRQRVGRHHHDCAGIGKHRARCEA